MKRLSYCLSLIAFIVLFNSCGSTKKLEAPMEQYENEAELPPSFVTIPINIDIEAFGTIHRQGSEWCYL